METNIGQIIYELRTKSHMTQLELAEKLNVSFQAVSKWEKGKTFPDITILPSIADIFGVSIDFLVRGKESARIEENDTHWAISFVNKLINPLSLNDHGQQLLLGKIGGYDRPFITECILIAYRTYVKSNDCEIRKRQVEMMLDKLGGVIYNESLGPVQKRIVQMVHSLEKRTGSDDPSAKKCLKQIVNEYLTFQCGKNASENDLLMCLNTANEKYFLNANNTWDCYYRILGYLDGERAKIYAEEKRKEEERKAFMLKQRINNGYFVSATIWTGDVKPILELANELMKAKEHNRLLACIFCAVDKAIRMMVNCLPEDKKPVINEEEKLSDYAADVYSWFGRLIGRDDANYILYISGILGEDKSSNTMRSINELDQFDDFMNRLYKKYVRLKNMVLKSLA